jgi:hypothetical protein
VRRSQADLSHSKATFWYQPKVAVAESGERTVVSFRDQIAIEPI